VLVGEHDGIAVDLLVEELVRSGDAHHGGVDEQVFGRVLEFVKGAGHENGVHEGWGKGGRTPMSAIAMNRRLLRAAASERQSLP